MKTFVTFFVFSVSLMLSGCGGERSWDAAEKYLRSIVQKSSQIKLVGLQKTDAQPGVDNFGSQKYVVEFECELEFTDECCWDGCLSVQPKEDPALAFASAAAPNGGLQQEKVKKGQHGKAYVQVFLDGDSHQGWRPSGHFKKKKGEVL